MPTEAFLGLELPKLVNYHVGDGKDLGSLGEEEFLAAEPPADSSWRSQCPGSIFSCSTSDIL